MQQTEEIHIRPTRPEDLDTVIEMETDPQNTPFIRQWTRRRHEEALCSDHYGHYIIEDHFYDLDVMSILKPAYLKKIFKFFFYETTNPFN